VGGICCNFLLRFTFSGRNLKGLGSNFFRIRRRSSAEGGHKFPPT